nr:unnamed protein product [Callosobruchus analis]
MDAVSLETPQENEFIKQRIARGNVRYIWTSGRKCNFAGENIIKNAHTVLGEGWIS